MASSKWLLFSRVGGRRGQAEAVDEMVASEVAAEQAHEETDEKTVYVKTAGEQPGYEQSCFPVFLAHCHAVSTELDMFGLVEQHGQHLAVRPMVKVGVYEGVETVNEELQEESKDLVEARDFQ